ncbi:sensor histidine kinase [Actinomadura sp. HBU206391]|uniref:sensor histidine kinase n=1 Tax=Actinomadura sp. HBU206391 TaxID=2731692 RepID=UPI0021C919CE|nr:HAMP domain-containing sensor histidine kinase [Actinomadura sp. HBU206391]
MKPNVVNPAAMNPTGMNPTGMSAAVRHGPWARMPLRVKLIAALLLLLLLALTAMGVAGVSVMRGYLVDRADGQLQAAQRQVVGQIVNGDGPHTADGTLFLRVPSGFVAQIRNAQGDITSGTETQDGRSGPRIDADAGSRAGGPFTVHGWRALVTQLPDGGSLTLALSMDEIDRTIGRLISLDLIVSAVVVIVLAGVGIWVVRTSMRPLVEIEQTAEAIASGHLARRVPEHPPGTEVGRLGRALNSMLAQIEMAFRSRAESEATARQSEERMRRFVADAGHELRTPLTAIRGFAELYRQGGARSPEELDRLIGRIEDTAARMGLLVSDLLLLARLDQQRPLERRPVDLLAVAADAVGEARVLDADRAVELAVRGGAAYQVLGDEPRLRQVLGNLLANALTHTPAGTPVEVRLRTADPGEERRLWARYPGAWGAAGPGGAPPFTPTDGRARAVVCEVADKGPGLTREQAERVFERFYRADQARGGDGGTGLGLAIVAALVAAHSGLIELDTEPGQGATFRVLLPLALD